MSTVVGVHAYRPDDESNLVTHDEMVCDHCGRKSKGLKKNCLLRDLIGRWFGIWPKNLGFTFFEVSDVTAFECWYYCSGCIEQVSLKVEGLPGRITEVRKIEFYPVTIVVSVNERGRIEYHTNPDGKICQCERTVPYYCEGVAFCQRCQLGLSDELIAVLEKKERVEQAESERRGENFDSLHPYGPEPENLDD